MAFPTCTGAQQLVAFPLTLPMGWTSSLLLFCAATKTVANLTNVALKQQCMVPLHCLEHAAKPDLASPIMDVPWQLAEPSGTANMGLSGTANTAQPPFGIVCFIVNDHITLAQGSPTQSQNFATSSSTPSITNMPQLTGQHIKNWSPL